MIIDVRLARLTASGGEVLEFPHAGVTCIVGGNNVGKSRLLREIDTVLSFSDHTRIATFSDLQISKPGIDEPTALAFLEYAGNRVQVQSGHPQQFVANGGGENMTAQAFTQHYMSIGENLLQATKPFFEWHASAGSLLSAAGASIGNPGMLGYGQPLVRLFRDGSIEQELSDLAEEAFGLPLILDRINGDVRLRVGRVDIPVPLLNRPSAEYADAILKLPSLEEQGDGIKSFLGLVLNVMAGTAQILLVDEPEAFLHPSQARTLGRWLSCEATRRNIQIVVSTHDRDFLLGLIDAESTSVVNIVRITRDGSKNHLHQLPHGEVAAVWSDPVMRYSNILQGLFHKRVAICESDADCRFYGAVLDAFGAESGRRATADDVLFVPSGGKKRVAAMARALTRLGVETFAVVDFDILSSRDDIKAVLEGLGSNWTDAMNSEYVQVAHAANQGQLWATLKSQGIAGLPPGQVNIAGRNLLHLLREAGVLVVPVGEMEDFDKSCGLHGAAWVNYMLDARNHQSCQGARDLLEPLLG